ncbi:MAG TPA: hypothetical protein VHO02_06335 [Fibrobacteria bacterium]|jgi:hypothetical protein|nr:hypothetical protein [Fibrobacteria bacterium]
MSFLEKEDGQKSAFWDWFIGIALLALVAGFTLYYQYQKRATQARFSAADTLFRAGDFAGASSAYETLKDASYLTAANDSTIYARLDTIGEMEERSRETVARARMRLAAGDIEGAKTEVASVTQPALLDAHDRAWLDSAKSALQ